MMIQSDFHIFQRDRYTTNQIINHSKMGGYYWFNHITREYHGISGAVAPGRSPTGVLQNGWLGVVEALNPALTEDTMGFNQPKL